MQMNANELKDLYTELRSTRELSAIDKELKAVTQRSTALEARIQLDNSHGLNRQLEKLQQRSAHLQESIKSDDRIARTLYEEDFEHGRITHFTEFSDYGRRWSSMSEAVRSAMSKQGIYTAAALTDRLNNAKDKTDKDITYGTIGKFLSLEQGTIKTMSTLVRIVQALGPLRITFVGDKSLDNISVNIDPEKKSGR